MNTLNNKRAKRCAKALHCYNDDCDAKITLVDFLADARHWCDRNGESFGELDRLAHRHYLAEIGKRTGG